MNSDTFEALGFVLLPDGTIYFFGKALDLIAKEELYDPYLWQKCSHEESLRKMIRNTNSNIPIEIAYTPGYYELLKQLVEVEMIVFLNRTKKSTVKQATIFLQQMITEYQYEQLMSYQTICNACEHMTVSYLKDGQLIEKNNITDLKAFIDSNFIIKSLYKKRK